VRVTTPAAVTPAGPPAAPGAIATAGASATAARPTKGAALYSSVRAGATMMAQNLAAEIASTGVQVNVLGTNFIDFPEFHAAAGTDDPEVRKFFEAQIPMKRMGQLDEFASFAMAFLDGTSGFTTGQFVGYADDAEAGADQCVAVMNQADCFFCRNYLVLHQGPLIPCTSHG
jgi:NAD(P)-dependent dehydrogenase (short-subunit alcohol dehydrogenase family)